MATINTTSTAEAALKTWVKPEDLKTMNRIDLDAIYDRAFQLILEAKEAGDLELEYRSTHNFNSVADENTRRYFLNKKAVGV